MVLGFIDIGKIIYNGNILEHRMDSLIIEYKKNPEQENLERFIHEYDRHVDIYIINNSKFTEIKLSKKMEFITPGLNLFMNSPYEISAKRVIYNE